MLKNKTIEEVFFKKKKYIYKFAIEAFKTVKWYNCPSQ